VSEKVADAIKLDVGDPISYFKSEIDEAKMIDLISNKIRVKSLRHSLGTLFYNALRTDLEKGIKQLVLMLDVFPPSDPNVNKWDACDHEKLIKVFKGLTIYFEEIVRRFSHIGTIVLRTIDPSLDQDLSYQEFKSLS
jgi:hypothetical protein